MTQDVARVTSRPRNELASRSENELTNEPFDRLRDLAIRKSDLLRFEQQLPRNGGCRAFAFHVDRRVLELNRCGNNVAELVQEPLVDRRQPVQGVHVISGVKRGGENKHSLVGRHSQRLSRSNRTMANRAERC